MTTVRLVQSDTDIDLADPAFWRRPHSSALDGVRAAAPVRDARCTSDGHGTAAASTRWSATATWSRPAASRTMFISGPGSPRRSRPSGSGSCSATRWSTSTTRGTPGLRGMVAEGVHPAGRRPDRRRHAPGSPPGSSTTSLARRPDDFVEAVAGQMPFAGHLRHDGHPARRTGGTCSASSNQHHRDTPACAGRAGCGCPGKSLRALARLHRVVARVGRQRRRRARRRPDLRPGHRRTSTASG